MGKHLYDMEKIEKKQWFMKYNISYIS